MAIIFLDSCIIIDYIKGKKEIKNQVHQIQMPCINFIVEMELMQGANDKRELAKIRKELSAFELLDFHNEIAKLSSLLLKNYLLSHNLQIADAIIAATSLVYDIPLFTHNKKDFRYIPNLNLYEIPNLG
ncbi:MAG TPA: type II toxin-antitoxin system VapC family toxin [Candidatus Kapabacteria bacterium]|nr:type II toxin-antitoxin system VapC family toxin [Candidatus Kapabacteria bacterium]